MSQVQVNYTIKPSAEYPHLAWIDLQNDGVLHECAIMRREPSGNILYFKTNSLDSIDKRRLAGILMDRNARNFQLWDLMANKTLGNGVNALTYFHQLVKQLTPTGKTIDPRAGQIGTGTIRTAPVATNASETPEV